MVSSFSVRPEQVDVLSADIANDAKGIAQELDNLDTQVKSLIEQWDVRPVRHTIRPSVIGTANCRR